jgi:uncharacterized protein YfaS (alpha-2-macroglobulin family)
MRPAPLRLVPAFLLSALLALAASSAFADTFTVKEVVPDSEKGRITLRFDAGACPSYALGEGLRFMPPVSFDRWSDINHESSEVVLKGEFKPGQSYRLFIPDGFECGGREYRKGVETFRMPDLVPELTLAEKGTVVERDSRQMLGVRVTNVEELAVRSLSIPPVLAAAAWRESAARPAPEALRETLAKRYAAIEAVLAADNAMRPFLGGMAEGRQLFFPGKVRNRRADFSVPMSFRSDREKGSIEYVSLQGTGAGAPSVRQLLRITDLSLSCKTAGRSILVWVTSLNSGKPVDNVDLLAITENDTLVPLGRTGPDGTLFVADVPALRRIPDPSRPAGKAVGPEGALLFVVAATGRDASFLRLGDTAPLSPDWLADQRGPSVPLRMHAFTERGVYRPGDTVHFKATAREFREDRVVPPKGVSLNLRIENPKQETVYAKKLPLSDFGTAADSLEAKSWFPLGTYTIHVTADAPGEPAPAAAPAAPAAPASMTDDGDEDGEDAPPPAPAAPQLPGVPEFTATFDVQEFRPPRHFVSLRFVKETTVDNTYVNLRREKRALRCEISGGYYAGGPVKNGKVRWKMNVVGASFRRGNNPDYTFGSVLERETEFLESGETLLDEHGKAIVTIPVGREAAAGARAVELSAVVVDFDGRAASETGRWQEEPEYLVGISKHDEEVSPNEGQGLRIVVVDGAGAPVPDGSLVAEVSKQEYFYTRKRNEHGHVVWNQELIFRKQFESPIAIKEGGASFDFDFVEGGRYIVRFTWKSKEGKAYSSSTAFSVRGGFNHGFEDGNPSRPFEKLSASPERKRYAPGDTARIHFNPHRPLASLLVSVERDGILETRVVTPAPGHAYVDIPIGKGHVPNVYVSLLGSVARGEFPSYTGEFDGDAPTFLFGVVPLDVKATVDALKVTVAEKEPALKALPGAKRSLALAARDASGNGVPAELAVAVVDESVLALTGYKTPTLEALGQFLVPLRVATRDLRTDLLRQTPFTFLFGKPLTGGDGEGEGSPVASRLRKNFSPVAFFDPAVRTDAAGNATVSFTLPDTMTTYRVFVVAVDRGSGFASTQRPLLVVKDFYLEPGVPRFLTRGDRFRFPVSAFNKTAQDGKGTFAAGADPLVRLTAGQQAFDLKGMDSRTLPVSGEALSAGSTKLSFTGTFDGREDSVELTLPVNSGYLSWTDTTYGTFRKAAGLRYEFPPGTAKIAWNEVRPDEVKARLTISGSPFLRAGAALRYLLHYPYGCVEQTSSGLLPLAALRNLIKAGFLPDITVEEADRFAAPGVRRLLAMQTGSGGFGYWPGDRSPHPWGSVYAATALTYARIVGLEVPQGRLDKAMEYLAAQLSKDGELRGGDRGHARFDRGHALFVLALNGKMSNELFRSVYGELGKESTESALLTVLAGKQAGFLKADEAAGDVRKLISRHPDKERYDEFRAYWREPAVSLLVAASLLPADPETGKLADRLLAGVGREGIWSSTADTGWSLIALGEYFSRASFAGEPVKVTLQQSGWPDTTVTLGPKDFYVYEMDAASFLKEPRVNVSVDRDVSMAWRMALTFPRTDYAKEGYSNGFRVSKTIENMDGGKAIKVGDVVKVDVVIEADRAKRWELDYVVLDDPLPAGLEAINSALKTEERVGGKNDKAGASWYWDDETHAYRFIPDHAEMRDDRVAAFRNHLWQGVYRYSYYARAVCAGEFVMPSTKVQLMYEPETAGYTPVGKLVIEER